MARSYPLWLIPLLTGAVPIVAIHGIYLVAATGGHVPWCVPYLDNCTSISATGRHGAGFYLFKGVMIPAAVLLALCWFVLREWVVVRTGVSTRTDRAMFLCGATAAFFLIVYAVALGAAGDTLRLQRRIGVILYFTLTFLAQLLLVYRTFDANDSSRSRTLQHLCGGVLVIGVCSVILDALWREYDSVENAFEWTIALLVHLFFVRVAFDVRRSRLRAGVYPAGRD